VFIGFNLTLVSAFFSRVLGRHAGPTRVDKWKRMGITSNDAAPRAVLLRFLFLLCIGCKCLASEVEATQTATLAVDASPQLARKIPDTLFGIFFEVRQ
jgi:alpha-L-arabinofuranosidase